MPLEHKIALEIDSLCLAVIILPEPSFEQLRPFLKVLRSFTYFYSREAQSSEKSCSWEIDQSLRQVLLMARAKGLDFSLYLSDQTLEKCSDKDLDVAPTYLLDLSVLC